ncbi:MerR family transcriptional regulator [Salinarimonas ramus]|nr:MerR family transcriptional regulator [Salinarimonas ramus]
MSRMQIGELAEKAGVSHRTIHFYERLGLVSPAERHGTGYRYYDDVSLKRLEKIGALKRLGLSLEEIGEVIDLYFEDATGVKGKRRVLEILEGHLASTRAKIAELKTFEGELEANVSRMRTLIAEASGQSDAA